MSAGQRSSFLLPSLLGRKTGVGQVT